MKRMKQLFGYAFAISMLFATVTVAPAATYPPLTCIVGQHINSSVNPVDANGKSVVLDWTKATWTFAPAGSTVFSVSAGSGGANTQTISCLAVGTATVTLSVTDNGVSNTTLSESFQVTVNPPLPAVTFGFVFQSPI